MPILQGLRYQVHPNALGEQISQRKYFCYKYLRYVWDEDHGRFHLLRGLDGGSHPRLFFQCLSGLSSDEVQLRQKIYGPNVIDVTVKSYGRLFLEEVADPFYVFQFCSIVLWSTDDYYYYALAILIVTMVSITITVYQTKMHLQRLRSMVAVSERVTVLRNNADEMDVLSEELVPGDVLVIPPNGAQVHCDSVLISGNCIVNESMLTGESVPVTKIPLPYIKGLSNSPLEQREEQYNPERHKRHTLFNGTNVIQTRYYGNARVLAVVVRTGFSTTKGGLMRSILSPKPVGFKFFRDSMRFIGLMTILAMVGFSYSMYTLVLNGMSVGKIVLKSLDVITIAVPPALPAAMSVGIVYALQRLKKKQIYCINPSRISVCGKLKLFCFDKVRWQRKNKTGTLTEDGLNLLGVLPVHSAGFGRVAPGAKNIPQGPILAAMATCHSLTMIDGRLSGDPLDLKMFEATDWILEEPGEDNTKFDNIVPTIVKPKTAEEFIVEYALKGHTPYEIAVVRQFPFSSDLQRMSVVCRTLGAPNMDVYVKGAPETITTLCQPQTVPGDFTNILQHYTMKGYRVLGLAWKPLDSKLSWHQVQRVTRDRIESDLLLLGLLIFQNALKPQSYPVIRALQNADIRTVMVTGDNMLTAVSVARDCGMIAPSHQVIELSAKLSEDHSHELHVKWCVVGAVQSGSHDYESEYNNADRGRRCFHVAVSGKTFALIRIHKPQLFNKVLVSGTVFARMSPDQKTHLIQGLQNLNYCVGMCGDGANDCGALKVAHAGISLSEAEASVASPFTSKIPHIECVPAVVREGRAALVTSFGIFKYMALYSIVQFVSVLLLYSISSNLGDWQYLYIDLVVITSLAVVMGKTQAYPVLVAKRPGGSLMSPIVLFSLISHIAVQTIVQVAGFYYVQSQSWFSAVHVTDKNATYVKCHQNAVLFALSSFQYIHLAVVFSGGAPYRQPFYKSGYFLLVVVFLTVFTGFLVVLPGETLQHFFQLATIPDKIFRWTLVGIAACNCLISLFIEMYIVPSQCLKKVLNRLFCKTHPKNYFRILQRQLEQDFDWPPCQS
ncbi:probable cation-transporting ATPase 13A3 isoform X4 [Stylophora pistillata]|uniref:probable cation-transporting ATPase 13A3 isoform X4 n=1 Tax=Stylophora pistillata TaxID=50429 RepID=UPI000C03D45D|nr:probable cation-transporting ATPase 13A3 isoform X4 [Stylophora pistillata]